MATNDRELEGTEAADELAAQFLRENPKKDATAAPPPEKPRSNKGPWICVAVFVVVGLVQLPTLRAAMKPKASIRAGAEVSDPQIDACIDALWGISALVQEGESEETITRLKYTDPLTGAAYAVKTLDDEIVIECPNPAAHGVKALRITASNPVPEVER